jgi:hypothetical protein
MQVEGPEIASKWRAKTVENRGQPVNRSQSTKGQDFQRLSSIVRLGDLHAIHNRASCARKSQFPVALFCSSTLINAKIAGMCACSNGRAIPL